MAKTIMVNGQIYEETDERSIIINTAVFEETVSAAPPSFNPALGFEVNNLL